MLLNKGEKLIPQFYYLQKRKLQNWVLRDKNDFDQAEKSKTRS